MNAGRSLVEFGRGAGAGFERLEPDSQPTSGNLVMVRTDGGTLPAVITVVGGSGNFSIVPFMDQTGLDRWCECGMGMGWARRVELGELTTRQAEFRCGDRVVGIMGLQRCKYGTEVLKGSVEIKGGDYLTWPGGVSATASAAIGQCEREAAKIMARLPAERRNQDRARAMAVIVATVGLSGITGPLVSVGLLAGTYETVRRVVLHGERCDGLIKEANLRMADAGMARGLARIGQFEREVVGAFGRDIQVDFGIAKIRLPQIYDWQS